MKNNNTKFNTILLNYQKILNKTFLELNKNVLFEASLLIEKKIRNNLKILVAGNGGSAAVSNHFICDFIKNVKFFTNLKPKVISLSSNVESIMAISNDLGYEKSLVYQAESLVSKKDLFVIISSSGNSKNIVELIKFAKNNNNKIIGLSAFDGGYLKKNSDVHIHVKINDYGISEDIFQAVMHVFVKSICDRNKR